MKLNPKQHINQFVFIKYHSPLQFCDKILMLNKRRTIVEQNVLHNKNGNLCQWT